ncbi:MAG TPA: hypothetical protein VN706_01575 [Gemmatimonadaceae bacterium]|nr:hypothetical protein [Gemmatimonadaceae bacterium]
MVLAQFGDGVCIARMDGAEQFLGLTLQLFQVRPHGQAANGHEKPP